MSLSFQNSKFKILKFIYLFLQFESGRSSVADEAGQVENRFPDRTVCETRAVDHCAGEIGLLQYTPVENGLFEYGLRETDAGKIAERENRLGQVGLFEGTGGQIKFFRKRRTGHRPFLKDAIAQDGTRKITARKPYQKQVRIRELAVRKRAIRKIRPVERDGRKIAGVEPAPFERRKPHLRAGKRTF